jgi:hypothetical protein
MKMEKFLRFLYPKEASCGLVVGYGFHSLHRPFRTLVGRID